MEVDATLQGYASPDHHRPITEQFLLDDVIGIMTFTKASPDPFTPVTCVLCKPALICEQNAAPIADMPILLLANANQAAWSWALKEVYWPSYHPHRVCF